MKPLIFPATQIATYESLVNEHPEIIIVDQYSDQLTELFKINHTRHAHNQAKKQIFITKRFGNRPETSGNWVYFPWRNTLVHLLTEEFFHQVRTARNYPLISHTDQQKFLHKTIAIVGLSVGSSIALTIAQSGGANTMKLADFDQLSLSNLNRLRGSTVNLGQNKTQLVAQQIYEINPYAQLTLYPDGLNPTNFADFFTGNPKPDIVIDEADDIATKQFMRLAARSLKLPLIMTTDNGFVSNTRVIRFDKSPHAGGMKEVPTLSFDQINYAFSKNEPAVMTTAQKLKLIAKLVGPTRVSYEMQKGSILTAKGQIAGWPQLAMTVFLGGSLATYAAQLIATGRSTYHTQSSFSIVSHLNPNYNSRSAKQSRQKHTQAFLKFLKKI